MVPATVTDIRALRHWLNGADGPHLVICCIEHPDPDAWSRAVIRPLRAHAVVTLATCVGEVSAAVLLELVAGGASGVTVALDGCANPAGATEVVTQAGAFLSALRRQETTGAASALPESRKGGPAWPVLKANEVPLSRRALLGRTHGLDLVAPSRHPTQRLIAVFHELTNGTGLGAQLDGIPTGVPRLTAAGCAGSGVCARTCPAGALTVRSDVLTEATRDSEAMAQFQLTFDPSRCTDCGQCLQVCPESALERSGEYLWSSLLAQEQVSLRVGLTRRCTRCGGPHGRLGDLCAVCAYRTTNPFGSTMPPGYLTQTRPNRTATE